MFEADAVKLRCVSGTPFGRLVVPLVCKKSATSSSLAGSVAPYGEGPGAALLCKRSPSNHTSSTGMRSAAAAARAAGARPGIKRRSFGRMSSK